MRPMSTGKEFHWLTALHHEELFFFHLPIPWLAWLLLTSSSPSLPFQISTSVPRGSTTAGRTPCASTRPAPSCASAIRASSGSMTIPAQVSSPSSPAHADLLLGRNQVQKSIFCFPPDFLDCFFFFQQLQNVELFFIKAECIFVGSVLIIFKRGVAQFPPVMFVHSDRSRRKSLILYWVVTTLACSHLSPHFPQSDATFTSEARYPARFSSGSDRIRHRFEWKCCASRNKIRFMWVLRFCVEMHTNIGCCCWNWTWNDTHDRSKAVMEATAQITAVSGIKKTQCWIWVLSWNHWKPEVVLFNSIFLILITVWSQICFRLDLSDLWHGP